MLLMFPAVLTRTVLIRAIKMAFQSIYVSGPEATELGEPRIEFLKWFRF